MCLKNGPLAPYSPSGAEFSSQLQQRRSRSTTFLWSYGQKFRRQERPNYVREQLWGYREECERAIKRERDLTEVKWVMRPWQQCFKKGWASFHHLRANGILAISYFIGIFLSSKIVGRHYLLYLKLKYQWGHKMWKEYSSLLLSKNFLIESLARSKKRIFWMPLLKRLWKSCLNCLAK